MKLVLISALVVQAAAAEVGSSPGTTALPLKLQGIGIEQRLGAQLPLDAQFPGANGNRALAALLPLTAGRCFSRWSITNVQCCAARSSTAWLPGCARLSLRPGRDFDVVAISINPARNPQ